MDPYAKFNVLIAVYNKENRQYLGLNEHSTIVMSNHIDTESGFARPVFSIPTICSVGRLEPYTVCDDILERTDAANSKVYISNYDLYVFLEEYEQAYNDGCFI